MCNYFAFFVSTIFKQLLYLYTLTPVSIGSSLGNVKSYRLIRMQSLMCKACKSTQCGCFLDFYYWVTNLTPLSEAVGLNLTQILSENVDVVSYVLNDLVSGILMK